MKKLNLISAIDTELKSILSHSIHVYIYLRVLFKMITSDTDKIFYILWWHWQLKGFFFLINFVWNYLDNNSSYSPTFLVYRRIE